MAPQLLRGPAVIHQYCRPPWSQIRRAGSVPKVQPHCVRSPDTAEDTAALCAVSDTAESTAALCDGLRHCRGYSRTVYGLRHGRGYSRTVCGLLPLQRVQPDCVRPQTRQRVQPDCVRSPDLLQVYRFQCSGAVGGSALVSDPANWSTTG